MLSDTGFHRLSTILLFLYPIGLLLAVAALTVTLLIYKKYRFEALKYAIVSLLGGLLMMSAEAVRTLTLYWSNDFLRNVAFLVVEPVGALIWMWAWPLIAFSLVGMKRSQAVKIFHAGVWVCFFSLFLAQAITGNQRLRDIAVVIGLAYNLYSILVVFVNFKLIRNPQLKELLRTCFTIVLILIIIMFLYVLLGNLFFMDLQLTRLPIPQMLFFLTVLGTIFWAASKYLFVPNSAADRMLTERVLKVHRITQREREIITLLLEGYRNDQIGEALYISPKTVKNHLNTIYRKTGTKNRVELANLLLVPGENQNN